MFSNVRHESNAKTVARLKAITNTTAKLSAMRLNRGSLDASRIRTINGVKNSATYIEPNPTPWLDIVSPTMKRVKNPAPVSITSKAASRKVWPSR